MELPFKVELTFKNKSDGGPCFFGVNAAKLAPGGKYATVEFWAPLEDLQYEQRALPFQEHTVAIFLALPMNELERLVDAYKKWKENEV